MRSYRYAVRTKEGRTVLGKLKAPSQHLAYAEVSERFGTVLHLEPDAWQLPFLKPTISLLDLSLWLRQLATMLDAGLTMRHSLEITAHSENARLNEVVAHVGHDLQTGHTLSAALSRHPQVFAPEVVASVWAGEESGRLTLVLGRIAEEYERAARLRSLLMAQLTYPACVLSIACILLVGFFVGIMPALAAVFQNLGVTLPWLTRMFIGLSKVMTDPYLAGAALLLLGVAGLALRRARGLLQRVVLRVPVLGDLLRKLSEIRMLTMLALMLQSGLHLSRALAAMPRLAVDPRAQAAWGKVQQGVMEGRPLPREIAAAGLFSNTIRALLTCGDEGGELVKLMQWSADLLDQELNFELQRLVALIEPLTVAGLGFVAGVAVLAAFLPLMELIQAFMG